MSCRLNTDQDVLGKFITTCTSADYFGGDEAKGLCHDAFHNSGASDAKSQLDDAGKFTPTEGMHNGCSQLSAEECTGLSGTADLAICITDGCKTNGNRCDRGFLETCAVGYACANGTAKPCVLGTSYQDKPGQSVCNDLTVCAAGQQVVTDGTTTADRKCSDCEAGTMSNAENAKECTPCEVGKTYQDQPGKTKCLPQPTCAPTMHRVADSASAKAECVAMIEHCQTMSEDGKSCKKCYGQYDSSDGTCKLQDNPLSAGITALQSSKAEDSKYSGDPDTPDTPASPTTSPTASPTGSPTVSPTVSPTKSPGTTKTCTVIAGQEGFKAFCDNSKDKTACDQYKDYCTWK